MIDWKPLAQALSDHLARAGHLRTRDWREVFACVPRHDFVPWFFEQTSPGHWERIDGTTTGGLDRWLPAVYSNTTLVTALQDVALPGTPGQPGFAVAVSSSTEPGLMAHMLEDLDVHSGHTVLEIGTGTGYNAALLCEHLGDNHVYSLDHRPRRRGPGRSRPLRSDHRHLLHPAHPPAWTDQLRPGRILVRDHQPTRRTRPPPRHRRRTTAPVEDHRASPRALRRAGPPRKGTLRDHRHPHRTSG